MLYRISDRHNSIGAKMTTPASSENQGNFIGIKRFLDQPKTSDKKMKVFLKLNKNGTLEAKSMSDKEVGFLEKMRMRRRSKEYDLNRIIKHCMALTVLNDDSSEAIKKLLGKVAYYNRNALSYWHLFRKPISTSDVNKLYKKIESYDNTKKAKEQSASISSSTVPKEEIPKAKEPTETKSSESSTPPVDSTKPKIESPIEPPSTKAESLPTVFDWTEYEKTGSYGMLTTSYKLTPEELKTRQRQLTEFVMNPATSSSDVKKLLTKLMSDKNLDAKLLSRETFLKLLEENKANRDNVNKIFAVLTTIPNPLSAPDLFSLLRNEKGISEEIIIDCIDYFPVDEIQDLKLINEGVYLRLQKNME